jgi:transposase-like protein
MTTEKIRRRYTEQEKSELVQAYQDSRNTQVAWCSEHHISVKTLHKWLEDNRQDKVFVQSFAPVSIMPKEEVISHEKITLHIGKCSVDVTVATDKRLLSEVLEMLVRLC